MQRMGMRRMYVFGLALALFMSALQIQAVESHAQDGKPLMIEGKKQLFQRVLTKPGAIWREGSALKGEVAPFTVLYLYGREEKDGKTWLEVGPGPNGQGKGFIEEIRAMLWNDALTLMFTGRADRDPVLFFRTRDQLLDICAKPGVGQNLANLGKQFDGFRKDSVAPTPDFPVAAMEPSDEKGSVSDKSFYLMPIHQMDETLDGPKLLKVATIVPGDVSSVRLGESDQAMPRAAVSIVSPSLNEKGAKPFKLGVAFVIDTTISMGPYIAQTQQMIRSIFDKVEKGDLADKVAFAVVAHRNSVEASPGLEYVSKVICDFTDARQRGKLDSALGHVSEARVSSHSISEDSMAGVKTAMDYLNWDEYAGRLIILVTDAGPLAAGDKFSSTKMGPQQIKDLATNSGKSIHIVVAHVKSKSGRNDHAHAEKSYQQLVTLNNALLTIPSGGSESPENFLKSGMQLLTHLDEAAASQIKNAPLLKPHIDPKPSTPSRQAEDLGKILGYAMRLDYLGRTGGNMAPEVVNYWVADTDLGRFEGGQKRPSLVPCVLMTRNMLDDLYRGVERLVKEAETIQNKGSKDFFDRLMSTSAYTMRDPGAAKGVNLLEMGYFGEFIEGLPYKSDVLRLTHEQWYGMSIAEQEEFIHRLKEKMEFYVVLGNTPSAWEGFGSLKSGDMLTRMPLTQLP